MISTLSLSSPVRLSIQQAQASLARAQAELSSGVKSDLGASLGAATGRSLSLRSEIDGLNTFKSTNAIASARLSASSNALDAMLSAAQSMSASLITASNSGGTTPALQSSARSALSSLIGALNTSAGGQFVFGGLNTDRAPVTSYASGSSTKQAIDDAFQARFGTSSAGSITGAQMQSFLDAQFASLFADTGWQANWSGASSDAIQSDISPSQSVTTSVSANETPFRQLAQAYAMLNEFTGQNLSADARAAVVSTASSLVQTAIAGLTAAQSTVGLAQSTISDAATRIENQVKVLQTSVDDLDGVDTYALASRITQLQTQLQASFELTSRLSQLSLVNYLNG